VVQRTAPKRALRGDGQKRTCPTWHGGVAHQPLAFSPVKNIAYGVGTEGCFSQNGGGCGPLQGRRRRFSCGRRAVLSDLLRRPHRIRRRQQVLAKAITDIETDRATVTAGGLVLRRFRMAG
jgi:alcohol dehydrogenase (cytochrome c)